MLNIQELYKISQCFLKIFVIMQIANITILFLPCFLLSQFHKSIYEKGTIFAWIPLCNLYLLGKLTFNKYAGLILIIFGLLTFNFTEEISNSFTISTYKYSILPEKILDIAYPSYCIILLITIICAFIKYRKTKSIKKHQKRT